MVVLLLVVVGVVLLQTTDVVAEVLVLLNKFRHKRDDLIEPLINLLVRASCRRFCLPHASLDAGGREKCALVSFSVRPIFVPWKQLETLSHFVSRKIKNKVNPTLNDHFDKERYRLVQKILGTVTFVAITTSDLLSPLVDVREEVFLPCTKVFRRDHNVGFRNKPLFPWAKARLDSAGNMVDFGLIGCRELIVDDVFRERRNLERREACHVLDRHRSVVSNFHAMNTCLSINMLISISMFCG